MNDKDKMVAILLRGVPDDVRREIKAAAAREGESMAEYIIEAAKARARLDSLNRKTPWIQKILKETKAVQIKLAKDFLRK